MHRIFPLFSFIGLALLAACSSVPATATPQPPSAPVVTPQSTLSSAQLRVQELWRRGPHSKVRLHEQDVNNACAKCHSPREWNPALAAGQTADCAAAVLNVSEVLSESPVDLSEWHAVDCQVCHRSLANGGFSTEVSYWNPETRSYEAVEDTSELCRNCHRQSESIDNSIDMGSGMHANLSCTACHEPHRGTASCTNSTCHGDLEREVDMIGRLYMPPGHESAAPHDCGGAQCHPAATQIARDNSFLHIGVHHGNLTCSACHDATGMEVRPVDDFLTWNTWQPVTWDGQEGKRPKFSHNVQRKVDCTRCHYEANPWRLHVLNTFSQ